MSTDMQCASYDDVIRILFGRLNFERRPTSQYAADFKLDRMRALLELLGNPHERIPVIHIAGTKGKGSTAVMCAAILQASGFDVGLFTSPHIRHFQERFVVNGRMPARDEVVDVAKSVFRAVHELDDRLSEHATFFEIVAAFGWQYFCKRQVDVTVLEVGLGGRLDATNVCHPVATVVTNIGWDHMRILGGTLPDIAREKAGILKPGIPVVSGVDDAAARSVIRSRSSELQCPLYEFANDIEVDVLPTDARSKTHFNLTTPWGRWSDLHVPLLGRHQVVNAALATAAVLAAGDHGSFVVDHAAVPDGLASVTWPVRIEVVGSRPTVVVDAAHNIGSLQALLETLSDRFPSGRRVLVFAASRDKDYAAMLQAVRTSNFDHVVLTQYVSNPRAVPADELRAAWDDGASPDDESRSPLVTTIPDPVDALQWAKQTVEDDDLICIAGSFFLAAELRERLVTSVPERVSKAAL